MANDVDSHHYLSLYLAPPDATGLAGVRHDHCVALWRVSQSEAAAQPTVSLVRYWELERVTGRKHHRTPLTTSADARAFLDTLLAEVGLSMADMSEVWGTPGLSTDDGYLELAHANDLPAHSIAHLFSSLLLDWETLRTSTILALALDAGPDWTLDLRPSRHGYAGCVAVRGSLRFFPVESPGLLWYLARKRLGREEGTLMALGSATTCRVQADVAAWVRDVPLWNPEEGAPVAEALLERIIGAVWSHPVDEMDLDPRFSLEENRQSAVMKLVDEASVAVVDRTVERCRADYGLDLADTYLALSGGYALNCPNNTRMMDAHGFRGLLAPPCVNDGGQALGLGLMGLHAAGFTTTGRFDFGDAYHGNDRLRLDEALREFSAFVEEVTDADLDQILDDLAAGPIAWVRGAAELGPRSLGNRSLLGDPTHIRSRDALNVIKQRQWWRPVAPIVLRPYVADWFGRDRPSPYMLEAMVCRQELAHLIPAALHLDGSARLQTVSAEQDPLLYGLIERFRSRTGVPMLCNTSLNDRGEPIVDDAVQALNFCVRRGIRTAYVDGRRIRLRETTAADAQALPAGPHPRADAPFRRLEDRWPEAWHDVQERDIPLESVFVAATNPGYRLRLSRALASDDPGEWHRAAVLAQRLRAAMTPSQRRLLEYSIERWGPAARPGALTDPTPSADA